MNAIQLLRSMHAEAKMAFKVILGTDDPAAADQHWRALQPILELHEELEDEFVYAPLQQQFGPGTPLGDWDMQHGADIAFVDQLIAQSGQLLPGTAEWRMCVATVMDALSNHVMDEEGQIFGRVEQVWGVACLEQTGAQMQKLLDKPKSTTKSKAARRRR
jgi:hypothetical protein